MSNQGLSGYQQKSKKIIIIQTTNSYILVCIFKLVLVKLNYTKRKHTDENREEKRVIISCVLF